MMVGAEQSAVCVLAVCCFDGSRVSACWWWWGSDDIEKNLGPTLVCNGVCDAIRTSAFDMVCMVYSYVCIYAYVSGVTNTHPVRRYIITCQPVSAPRVVLYV